MSFPSMLYSFFLTPIQLIFELIYSLAYRSLGNDPGLAIIALSLAMNLLVLPLYRRADAMQEEERVLEAKLHDGVAHIKKTFHGDERTMILQTYYRQNNYSPLYVLRSAVSLLLEIPFFIAAYRFLSGLSLLQGVSFGPISDLGKPDGLLSIAGVSINILPVIMTVINLISTYIFTKGYPLKTKIQLYGMAVFFLVFLYDSPAGLVFYWTLNNLFSLVKTIFYKLKNPKKVLRILMLCLGIGSIAVGIVDYNVYDIFERFLFLMGIGLVLIAPFIVNLVKSRLKPPKFKKPEEKYEPNKKLFLWGAVFLTVLAGILIPSSVINASPQEFIIVGSDMHPVWYVVSSFLTAAGLFILWMSVFYWLFSPKAKVIFERLIVMACSAGTATYLFFGNHHGTLSSELVYDGGISYTLWQMLLNLAVIIAVSKLFLIMTKKKVKLTQGVLATATLAVLVMSGINIAGIMSSVSQIDMKAMTLTENQPKLTLSKDGKNVVVLMLDRAMGEYVPFIMQEHPELKEEFAGFTYYSDVVSFGGYTNFGVPAMFGGYEYTPAELNKRDNEKLEDKHDESLKVMPVLFNDNGYKTTVCDPPYAGYKQIPDLTIYDDYPEIDRYITQGTVLSADKKPLIIPNRERNFFCYSIVKMLPTCIQPAIYDEGVYHQLNTVFSTFEKSYDVLKNMSDITVVNNDNDKCFVMMDNETTHSFVNFNDDDYLEYNSKKELKPARTIKLEGTDRELKLETVMQQAHYETNVAAFKRLAEWFKSLKESGAYDNTRIVLCSDHGRGTQQLDELMIDSTAYDEDVEVRYGDVEFYYPLLMVKDFNSSKEFKISDEFMTNADVPTIATQGLIDSPKNPFTGKTLDSSAKEDPKNLTVIASAEWDVFKNNGTTYLPSRWYSVKDSIWKKDNWKLLKEYSVSPY